MPIAPDAVVVATLARELEERLRGARLRAVRFERAHASVALLFREGTLRFGMHPERGTIAWLEAVDPSPEDRPLAARVRGVHALPDDRVLIVALARVRGSPPGVDLVLEWISNRWNAALVEGPDRIVRQVLAERGGERAPRSGHPWTPPAPSDREGVDGQLDLARWRDLLENVPPERRRGALLGRVAWTSALNVDWLVDPGAGDEDPLELGHARWEELAEVALGRRPPLPCTCTFPGPRGPRGPQPYPWAPPGVPVEPTPTLLDAFARAAEELPDGPEAAPAIPAELLEAVRERAVRAWARVDALRRELEQSPDPAVLRGLGDLLLARLAEVPSGEPRVRLTGFDGIPVDVALDPSRSPQENARDHYERAARAERARERLPELLARAERDARGLDALVRAAHEGHARPEELRAAAPPEERSARGPGRPAPALPYRSYRSSGGLEIRVGRGARQNDDLTFHHSAPDDVWLHARHAAGAHVVLRWTGAGNPPARDLAEAAALAALYSKARTSGSVPVDWTRRKYVRKPRRSPPGQVLVERAKTLFASPDPSLEERLRNSTENGEAGTGDET